MKLSIVIPTYNGVRFMDKLIPILQNQGVPQEEYEILFVDDCSMDDTREKQKELSESFPNVRYIFNDKNKKLATTCNVGLNNAKGDYVWFVDQDDEIVEEAANKLLNICYDDKLDVMLFNYSRIDEEGNFVDAPQVFKNSEVIEGRTFLHTYFEHTIVVYLFGYRWRALFRRQYLLENGISFPDGLMHDDTTFLFQAIYNTKRIKSIADSIYLYRVNLGSYTHSVKASRIYEQYILVASEELQVAKQMNAEDTGFIEQITEDAQQKINVYVHKLALLPKEERRGGYGLIKNSDVQEVKDRLDSKTAYFISSQMGYILFEIYCAIYRLYVKAKGFAKR